MFPDTPANLGLDALSGLSREQLIFSCVSGSHAYGTNHAGSDVDIRGIYGVPAAAYLALHQPAPQISDERNDVSYYSLRRFIELAAAANPNILELLYCPQDCILLDSPAMQLLREQRSLFITRLAFDSHLGYARAQIGKARGQNKWINNPQPEAAPQKEDYCWVIPTVASPGAMPMRPRPLLESGLRLEECHASSMEHSAAVFRLYHYGTAARGVFRDGNLTCDSIPLDDELRLFWGLLIYNRDAYQAARRDHENYWHWMATRNTARWQSQEQGSMNYDAKNMLHCIRLILSGTHILSAGEPLVRFEGEQLQLLRDILAGRFAYAELIELADARVREMEQQMNRSSLPAGADMPAIEQLLREATAFWENNHA